MDKEIAFTACLPVCLDRLPQVRCLTVKIMLGIVLKTRSQLEEVNSGHTRREQTGEAKVCSVLV